MACSHASALCACVDRKEMQTWGRKVMGRAGLCPRGRGGGGLERYRTARAFLVAAMGFVRRSARSCPTGGPMCFRSMRDAEAGQDSPVEEK